MQVLTLKTLQERVQLHAKENLYFVFGAMKSGTLALAALTFYQLVGDAWGGDKIALLRLPAWVASFWVAWLTYNNVSVFSNLTTFDAKSEDLFILFAKTIIEMILFLVLQKEAGWRVWPLLYGLITGISYLKIKRFMDTMEPCRYEARLHPLLRMIRDYSAKHDLRGTLGASSFFMIAGILEICALRWSFFSAFWLNSCALVLTLLAFIPLALASSTGNKIRQEILKALEEGTAKSSTHAA